MRAARRLDVGQLLQLVGIVAAVVLAGIVNVIGARHFTRWDWTQDRRWSPSPATVVTLRGLEQQVDVWVIAGAGEPVEQTVSEDAREQARRRLAARAARLRRRQQQQEARHPELSPGVLNSGESTRAAQMLTAS